jgi:hypothetical protein
MRSLDLLAAAAAAERLRLRLEARRAMRRILTVAIAALFALAAIGFAHVAGWQGAEHWLGALGASLLVGGIDLAIAIVLLLIAAGSRPEPAAIEARVVRQMSLRALRETDPLVEMIQALGMRAALASLLSQALARLFRRE